MEVTNNGKEKKSCKEKNREEENSKEEKEKIA